MRFRTLDTADWHIGHFFHEYDRICKYLQYLDWLVASQTIKEKTTKANGKLAKRRQALDKHKRNVLSERLLQELSALNNIAKLEVGQKRNKKTENSFRLQQNEANKDKTGNPLKNTTSQAAITENWSKLNKIIGPADGKKSLQIAQEYTLDVSLGSAKHPYISPDRQTYYIVRSPLHLVYTVYNLAILVSIGTPCHLPINLSVRRLQR